MDPVKVVPVNMYRSQVELFARAVLEGGQVPVPGTDGLWSQTVMRAAYRSAGTGKSVRV